MFPLCPPKADLAIDRLSGLNATREFEPSSLLIGSTGPVSVAKLAVSQIRRSEPDEARSRPSGLNVTGPPPASVRISRQVLVSQSFTTPQPEARSWPSGLKATP